MSRFKLTFCLSAWVALFGAAGCYKATFYQSPSALRGEHHEAWSTFFIFGLVGTDRFDVRSFCGADEVAEVGTGGNFATSLVSALTIGIYTPRKVYVTCAAKPGQARASSMRRLELAIDTHGRPVRADVETPQGFTRAALEQAGPETFRVRIEGVSL